MNKYNGENMKKTFEDLLELSKHLRGPEGCPWDKEQTLDTLRPYIIEEAYEVVQAIEQRDRDELIEELGDLFYEVLFASQIAEDEGEFDIGDVIDRSIKSSSAGTRTYSARKRRPTPKRR